jgi:exonuclease SbcC
VRLVRISVENFRAVRKTAIDFAPGLNVLYGPNDLGKSTVAMAIRAALLTPPGSSEAETYASWFTAENPRVELIFADNNEHYWRVKKTFGTSSSSSAELLHSKDGKTFAPDSKGRVEHAGQARGTAAQGPP